MFTIVNEPETVQIPDDIRSFAAFRNWARSESFPETGRFCWLNAALWIDMSKEQIFTHNRVKAEFTFALVGLSKQLQTGDFYADGMLVSNPQVELYAQPDGTFISDESLRTGVVRLIPGVGGGFLEMEGSPDMVLEVVSAGSIVKDNVTLRDLYWRAGVREYWLADVRGADLVFDILGRGADDFVEQRAADGWCVSHVFGRQFRLLRTVDRLNHPAFQLEIRS